MLTNLCFFGSLTLIILLSYTFHNHEQKEEASLPVVKTHLTYEVEPTTESLPNHKFLSFTDSKLERKAVVNQGSDKQREFFIEMLKKKPDSITLRMKYVYFLGQEKNYTEALNQIDEVLKREPNHIKANELNLLTQQKKAEANATAPHIFDLSFDIDFFPKLEQIPLLSTVSKEDIDYSIKQYEKEKTDLRNKYIANISTEYVPDDKEYDSIHAVRLYSYEDDFEPTDKKFLNLMTEYPNSPAAAEAYVTFLLSNNEIEMAVDWSRRLISNFSNQASIRILYEELNEKEVVSEPFEVLNKLSVWKDIMSPTGIEPVIRD